MREGRPMTGDNLTTLWLPMSRVRSLVNLEWQIHWPFGNFRGEFGRLAC